MVDLLGTVVRSLLPRLLGRESELLMWELYIVTCFSVCISHSDQWFDDLETCQSVGSTYIASGAYCASDSSPRIVYAYEGGVWFVVSGVGI